MKFPEFYKLNDGHLIPSLGFGTWRTTGNDTREAVAAAIRFGYRLIDTAAYYGNEEAVGEAIGASGIAREELFITTKLWNDVRGKKETRLAVEESLRKLRLERIDLYLIHWPIPKAFREDWVEKNAESWRLLETMKKEGKIGSLGVSNFLPHHLVKLLETAEILPAVDQIELHPGLNQEETVAFCREREIQIEAWSPLGRGRTFENDVLNRLAKFHGKSVAQICLRWLVQKGIVPIPKSANTERILENWTIYDFSLSPEEMGQIDAIPPMGWSGRDPDDFPF